MVLSNMIDKTMCEVLWRNISDFYVNLRVEVASVSRNRYGVEKTVDTHKRYFVIKLHTWFCLSYFLKTNIKCYCIYQYFMSINSFFNTVSVSRYRWMTDVWSFMKQHMPVLKSLVWSDCGSNFWMWYALNYVTCRINVNLVQDKNTSLKWPVGISPLQLVNLHRNRRYFVIKLHTWFCLSYFLKTNIKFYCIYQYFIQIRCWKNCWYS
jgi:hypothetical protein